MLGRGIFEAFGTRFGSAGVTLIALAVIPVSDFALPPFELSNVA
jgi:hypothetical protein